MNILIISGKVMPATTPRSFRATELAIALARMGHNVTVYAHLGNYDYSEFEASTGVKVRAIKLSFPIGDSSDNYKLTFWDRVRIKLLRKFVEYPTIEFVWKVLPVIKREGANTDLLISIGFPYPIHWGCAWAKKRYPDIFPKCWISDCGDPYMGNAFEKPLPYFKYIEKWWGKSTDYITIPIEEGRDGYYPEVQDKIRIIPQGFDFEATPIARYVKNCIPTFVYAGNFYPGYRDVIEFLQYLSTLEYNFKFIIYTKSSVDNKLKKQLGGKLEVRPYIPRGEMVHILSTADFLINIRNKSQIQSPSKLIDYAISKRPILSISTKFKEQAYFEEFIKGDYSHQTVVENIDAYRIENVASKFLDIANRHLSK